MLNKPCMYFTIWCFIYFILAPSIPSEVITVPSTSSQNKNQSNEVMALLEFKHKSVEADGNGVLDDWTPTYLSPCSWVGVSCSPSGQVSALNLTGAGLAGRLFIDDLMALENLQHLYLSGNLFSGNLLRNMSSYPCVMETLDLSFNKLSEPISKTFFDSCDRLTSLNLSHNKLQGKIPAALGDLRNLKYLNLAHNDFSGNIPPELGWTCRTIVMLDLSGNRLSGEFPNTFKSCDYLQSLNLGNNQLSGNFLGTVISTLPRLQILQVPFNNITGPIPPSLANITKLQVLNLSSNAFTGNVPTGLCSSSSTSLQKLLLAGNFLSGPVPADIGNCNNLRAIDFSFNNLSGSIPPRVWMLPQLSDLTIWGNSFTGEIPRDISFNRSNLQTLILNNNLFRGPIPESVSYCKSLVWLSLSSNQLSGEVPAGIGKLQKLGILQLDHNYFTGRIPPELGSCQSLVWLQLNNNHFNGSIPSELVNQNGIAFKNDHGWDYAYVRSRGEDGCDFVHGILYSQGIRPERLAGLFDSHSCSSIRVYHGTLSSFKTENGSMIFLDLSFNFLSGSIPDSLSSMSNLSVLDLGDNTLTGTIPESLGSLSSLGVLDLSHNQLQGSIPESLGSLDFLMEIDVSNNNLSGTIPMNGQFQTFPASAFENNSGLCGLPLLRCDSKQPQADHNPSSTGNEFEWMWLAAWIGYINGAIIGIFAGIILFELKYQWFMETFRITPRRRSKQLKYSRQRQPRRR
ncbi:hypothetical protein PTKIN_Ptkin14bG0179200 [Pterospermum kingtungense]